MSQMRTAPCHRRRVAEKSEQIEHSEFNPRDSKNQPTILWRELFRATSDHRTESALAKYGVTDPEATLICGLARVSPLIHLFEPSDNGDPAVILPIFNGFELVDLIAFDPRQPEVVWCRVGGEPLLGINWLANAGTGATVRVFATPLAWLRAACQGVVVLDPSRSFDELGLYGVSEVWIVPKKAAA